MTAEHCNKCGGPSVLEKIEVNGQGRARVQCQRCHRMTMHHATRQAALAEWTVMQTEQQQPRSLADE